MQRRNASACPPFAEGEQRDFERIELRVIPDGSGRKADLAGLTACARRLIHPSIEIEFVAVEALPPGPGGKFEEFVSQVVGAGVPRESAANA